MEYRSQEINNIMLALATAQGNYRPLVANTRTPGGKYANLQAILDSVRDALSSNGLGFYQYVELLDEGSGAALLWTVLGHESGQYVRSCARVFTGKTDRQTGNIYEIHKRFHALMVLGIAPSDHDPVAFDDNGAELADFQVLEQLKKPTNYAKASDQSDYIERISNDQYNDLLIELEGYPDIAKGVMDTYAIDTLADLPKEQYHQAANKVRLIKKRHQDYLSRER